jgi:hypothetical protein
MLVYECLPHVGLYDAAKIIKGEKMITLAVGAERREEAYNPPLIKASNAFAFISDGP